MLKLLEIPSRLRLLKIPLRFFIIGTCWALFSDYIITFSTQQIEHELRDIYRGLNDFVFVIIVALILYFEIRKQEHKLLQSEEDYRKLFESNPNPMWIYNRKSMRFVGVNEAAIAKYGYSRKTFLKMTIYDIRPLEDKARLNHSLIKNDAGILQSGMWEHVKNSGELFKVSVTSNNILFDNQQCRLVMATDISELISNEEKLQNAYQKIKTQNEALLQLTWSNSHEVRKPLCSILSLITLLKESTDDREKEEYISLIEKCTTEIDAILKKSNNEVDLVGIGSGSSMKS